MDAVVVTHNSAADLPGLFDCKPLLDAFDRVVIVDNDSTDNSREIVQAAGGELIARNVNDGFGAGANAGARATTSEFFALLNPDIRFATADIGPRLEAAFDDPAAGIVGPKLILPDGAVQDSARRVPTPLELALRRRSGREQQGAIHPAHKTEVPWIVAACIALRREAFDAVGGFDERYFLYFEDVDLCVRMRRAGWTTVMDPTIEVDHHHRAASRAGIKSQAMRWHMKSAARFFARNPRYVLGRDLTS